MSNIREKDGGKTTTTILKASRRKYKSWQLYRNEKNGLQQFQMEICQPIIRVKDKKKKNVTLKYIVSCVFRTKKYL